MRKLMMTATLFLLAATFVLAQPGRGQRGPKGANPFAELDLSTEQKDQMKTIRTEARAKMETLRGQQDRAAMAKVKEETKAAMEAVLTPTQRDQYAKLMEERKAARAAVDKDAIRADLKAYHKNEVAPVIKAARGQLDAFIAAEDQVALDRLREVFKTKPSAQYRADRKAGERGERPTAEQMEERKAAGKAWKEAHAQDIAELKALTVKYEADLKRVQDRLQPEMEKWAKEKREIRSAHLPEGASERARKKGNMPRGKKESGRTDKAPGHDGWPKAAAFLLMKA